MFLFKQPLPTAKPSYVEEKLKPFSLSTLYEDKVSGGSDNVNPGLKMKPLCTNYVLTFKYFLRKTPCLLAIIGELIVLDFCGGKDMARGPKIMEDPKIKFKEEPVQNKWRKRF